MNLPAGAAGQSVQWRWRFGADTGTGYTGWYVDTVSVIDHYTCGSGPYAPNITTPPQDAAAYLGTAATFSVGSVGDAPLNYQWQHYGTNLMDGGVVAGANSNLLTLSAVQLTDAGPYQVTVTNIAGAVTSAAATLTVLGWPSFQTVTANAGVVNLTWSAVAGTTYQLQYRTNLSQGAWVNLGPGVSATHGTASASDAVGPAGARFYRLLILP